MTIFIKAFLISKLTKEHLNKKFQKKIKKKCKFLIKNRI